MYISFLKRVFIVCLIQFFILTPLAKIHGQGIRFIGSDHPIDKRTSLTVFTSEIPTFHANFDINFDLQLSTNTAIGYIFRIKEVKQVPIYNLYYDEEGQEAVFRLNEEGKSSLITIKFDKQKLKQENWFSVRIRFDLHAGELSLKIADSPEKKTKVKLNSPYSPKVTFGKSDYMIDVPSMSIRNLQIGNIKNKINFPLRESSGTVVHNSSSEAMGTVENGIWLLNTAFHWTKNKQLLFSSQSGSAYSPNTKSVYYFNKDSLQIYQLSTDETQTIRFKEPCPVRLKLAHCFIDAETNRLYVYETYYSDPYTGATVASLDLSNYSWRSESSEILNSELNHHGALFLPEYHKLLIFGGFGNMLYSSHFTSYDLNQNKWDKQLSTSGDRIFPRYFTSMGYSAQSKKAYIFGGMGNESGQHIVGRKYFYDLYELDPSTMLIKKLWEVDWKESPFVPARGVVIPDSESLYILGYPEHLTHSFIKLRRFSLQDGQHEQLGDSIPIYSDKISTHANLFYDEKLNKWIGVVQESEDDIHSKLSVYSLDFPAINEQQLHSFPQINSDQHHLSYALVGLIILIGGAVLYRIYSPDKNKSTPGLTEFTEKMSIKAEPETNCIYLFGDFTLINRQGMDISHLLSARLKQVFYLILFHNKGAGISSKLLSYLLWPDKPKDKVKTSRGVAINNLRKVLSELDGVEVTFEDGHFMICFQSSCYCDYRSIREQLLQNVDVLTPEFTKIIERGKFLLGIDDPLFDQVKADLENQLIEGYQEAMIKNLKQQQWIWVIQAAEMLVILDPVNEQALEQGLYAMHTTKSDSRAKLFYHRFSEQYQLVMGEEYPHSYEEVCKKTANR